MGVSGILDRYRQIRPRVIFTETIQRYSGKNIDLIPKWVEVAKQLSSLGLERVVLVPGVGDVDREIKVPMACV